MNREVKSTSMTTTNKIRAALLLGCALGASEAVAAAGQAEPAPAAPAAPATPAKGASGGDAAEVKALQKQLKAVQAQLRELAEQNKALLEHQKVIDREIQQQQDLLAKQQAAMQAQLSAQAGGGQGGAGGGQVAQTPVATGASAASSPATGTGAVVSATPAASAAGSNSALPDTTSPTPEAPMGASGPLATLAQNIKLWGYGEVYYMNPIHDRERAQADLARAVFGIGYSFDSRTEFNSEYEVEHAVSSASDPGEFEVEQFYVDRQLNDAVTVRGGLFLMPFGLLNEHHEPTNFYGVQRNFVETLIIPSTWREGGLNLHGDTQSGFGWNVGVTTGFDLSKWDFAPEFPQYTTALELEDNDVAPLQATHQELALANGHDLSQYVALSYFGLPGLTVGGAITTGKAVSVAAPPNAPIAGSQRVTLWEGHARWTPDKFDLSALYAHGSISNLAGTNAENPGSPNPIPSSFYGYYFQAAYDVWQHGNYRLSPFTRWEVYNMGSSYEGTTGPMIPTGSIPLTGAPGDYGLWPRNFDRVWTIGANLYVTPHVVLKLDYQHFLINNDFTRIDLGLGLNF
jgi:Phosphate-selective porin O and P